MLGCRVEAVARALFVVCEIVKFCLRDFFFMVPIHHTRHTHPRLYIDTYTYAASRLPPSRHPVSVYGAGAARTAASVHRHARTLRRHCLPERIAAR